MIFCATPLWRVALSLAVGTLAVALRAAPMRDLSAHVGPTSTEEARPEKGGATGALATLVRTPNTKGGVPPYALADQSGEIHRYVEATPGVDLDAYVGETVRVKHDTGVTLLATQLELSPVIATEGPVQASNLQYQRHSRNVRWADHVSDEKSVTTKITKKSGTPVETISVTPEELPMGLAGPGNGFSAEPLYLDGEESIEGEFVSDGSATPGGGFTEGCNCPKCQAARQGMTSNRWAGAGGPNDSDWRGYWNNDASCNRCSTLSCRPGSRGTCYGRVEYLMWWFDGFDTPPLVTTSPTGTPQADAGVLGEAGTTILYGGNKVVDGRRNGMRFMLGVWLVPNYDLGIEGDAFWFETETEIFSATGTNGNPILARPFFNMVPQDGNGNVLPPAEDAELVSFPNLLSGTVSVISRSEFGGTGLRLRKGICCKEWGCSTCQSCCGSGCCSSGCCDSCRTQGGNDPWMSSGGGAGGARAISRIDAILGWRFLRLDERLQINEDLTSLSTQNPGNFDITDQFDTANEFHGVDLGFLWEFESRRWSLELLSKIALGSTRQRVAIDGSTTVSNNGTSFTQEGGLLALSSNIGSYELNDFAVVPELGATLGCKLTDHCRLTLGYTFLYWSRVARPGDQIDRDVNPNLLPPAVDPLVGPLRPEFAFRTTDFWAQGLNFGLDCRF